jgi:hypothetical protein
MKKLVGSLLLAGLVCSTPLLAQEWREGRWDRDGYGDRSPRDYSHHATCESNRAQRLYFRIRREVRERDLDWQTARDIRAAVERTADWERRACVRGINDYQAARIDRQYDRIEDQLRREIRGGWASLP